MKNEAGSALLATLIVIALLGMMSTWMLLAPSPGINSQQSNNSWQDGLSGARDIARIDDVKSLQNALAAYYADVGTYPPQLVSGASISNNGEVYLLSVPSVPVLKNEANPCWSPLSAYDYRASEGLDRYEITLCLENSAGSLAAGKHIINPEKPAY